MFKVNNEQLVVLSVNQLLSGVFNDNFELSLVSNNHLLKVKNRNRKKCEIWSKLIIITPGRRQ